MPSHTIRPSFWIIPHAKVLLDCTVDSAAAITLSGQCILRHLRRENIMWFSVGKTAMCKTNYCSFWCRFKNKVSHLCRAFPHWAQLALISRSHSPTFRQFMHQSTQTLGEGCTFTNCACKGGYCVLGFFIHLCRLSVYFSIKIKGFQSHQLDWVD